MTDYEPTPEQVEAAARAIFTSRLLTGDYPEGTGGWDEVPEDWRQACWTDAHAALTAAGPLIAAEVLDDAADEMEGGYNPATLNAERRVIKRWLRARAARIARGEGS